MALGLRDPVTESFYIGFRDWYHLGPHANLRELDEPNFHLRVDRGEVADGLRARCR